MDNQDNLNMVLQKIEVIFETILDMQNRINDLESQIPIQDKEKEETTSQSKINLRVI